MPTSARVNPVVVSLRIAIAIALLGSARAGAITLPPSFVSESVTPGATFDTPTAIAFLPDGRLLVAEKRGRVLLVANGAISPTAVWQGELEVMNNEDRGLVGIAVDPQFTTTRLIYLLYVVDPDSNGSDNSPVAFGRLTRYQLTAANVADTRTRTVLLGATWAQGIPCTATHAVGSLRWGTDGTLLLSVGDGAHFTNVDRGAQDPSLFAAGRTPPLEDIGSYRAQYLGSLAGKILRLDPSTGRGLPSNPFYDGNPDSPRSKVWAYGFRNPFRFGIKPGTGSADRAAGRPGTLYVGDVGWKTWEEIDVARSGGGNFGWPCDEGPVPNDPYLTAPAPPHSGCATIGTPANPSLKESPIRSWHHDNQALSQPPGIIGNCVVGGPFYDGSRYPAGWRSVFFFADYGRNWIRAMVTDAADQAVSELELASDADGPVDLALDPVDRDLHYVSILKGEVRRIRYVGSSTNRSPTASANGTPDVGLAPLDVAFSTEGSIDPDGDPLTWNWMFGDGSGSTAAAPHHVYGQPGSYPVVLIASDGRGGTDRDTLTVLVAASTGFPGTSRLDDFDRPDGPVGNGWLTSGNTVVIRDHTLTQSPSTPAWAIWPAVFGATQEAWFRFAGTSKSATDQNLMLAVQGTSRNGPHLEIQASAQNNTLRVVTGDPISGWRLRAGPITTRFRAGDELGARAYPGGFVEVMKNRVVVLTASLPDWPYARSGGRIGIALAGASGARHDDFGGGNAQLPVNTPPRVTIETPVDRSFYGAGQAIRLRATAVDSEDPPGQLRTHWDVFLHHNNHVHPVATSDRDTMTLIGQDHDDGTGVHIEARAQVTDRGGLTDAASVTMYPEIDLEPGPLTVSPASPGTSAPARYTFVVHNHGSLPAPLSRWRLLAGDMMLAEGDVPVPARDSIVVAATLQPRLAAGDFDLRVTLDTLNAVVETREDNNGLTRPLRVIPGGEPPAPEGSAVMLSSAIPSPSRGGVQLQLQLPDRRRVEFQIVDLLGRVVWSDASRELEAGVWELDWPGQARGMGQARSGIYLARVQVGRETLTRRLVIVQ